MSVILIYTVTVIRLSFRTYRRNEIAGLLVFVCGALFFWFFLLPLMAGSIDHQFNDIVGSFNK